MKRVTLLFGMLLAVSASVASAAGVNIRWNDCITDGSTGAINKNFACASNLGQSQFFGSFQMDSDLAEVSGTEVVIDLTADDVALPAWWDFVNPSTCRTSALAWNLGSPGADCVDWASLQASGGIGAYNNGQRGPNTARIITASAVPNPVTVVGNQEFYAFTGTVQNILTTGVGACAGCSTPVCIVFNSINITTPLEANNRKLFGPTNGTDSNHITWQGGGNPTVGGVTGCPASTPTRNATWGQVKALYH